jgi:hypothetical protein
MAGVTNSLAPTRTCDPFIPGWSELLPLLPPSPPREDTTEPVRARMSDRGP